MSVTKENSMRLQKVEKDIALIQQDISHLKNNHLKHIEITLTKLDKRMWWILTAIISAIITGIVTISLNI